MTKKSKSLFIDQEVSRLEEQVDFLLATLDRLMKENRSLRSRQESLATERANMLEKHDMVRTRVDGIVTRLKALESGA
ncbi:MAG: TIGR02449 family protein [Pseudomonadota bacterium]